MKSPEEAYPHAAGPCLIVIFGAAGDLTKRMLIPALWNLSIQGLMPLDFAVLGVARGDFDDASFRVKLRADMKEFAGLDPSPELDAFLQKIHFLPGDVSDPDLYPRLAQRMHRMEGPHGTLGNRLYYMAVLPKFFSTIASSLSKQGLLHEEKGCWARVIVEKPFGRSYDSAVQLNQDLRAVLKESQIYRIDHYLGKETVQNLLALRYGNAVFEPIWNRRYIDHVQITAAETLGVEHRGPFYEGAGALRDMMSNHLFQLLAFIAMEPPVSFDADAVRDEKMKVVRAVKLPSPDEVRRDTVRGQYGPGKVEGKDLAGYRSEENVDPKSQRETYAAVKLNLDNWRWAGVPFYVRTGKRLAMRKTEIRIQFKSPPFLLFENTQTKQLKPNTLVVHIQPQEKIDLIFSAKKPGPGVHLEDAKMDFNYAQHFGAPHATGYETLLYDCMLGDATQFQRGDMAEGTWKVMDRILSVWENEAPADFPNYAAGSQGPKAADELLSRDGRFWRDLS